MLQRQQSDEKSTTEDLQSLNTSVTFNSDVTTDISIAAFGLVQQAVFSCYRDRRLYDVIGFRNIAFELAQWTMARRRLEQTQDPHSLDSVITNLVRIEQICLCSVDMLCRVEKNFDIYSKLNHFKTTIIISLLNQILTKHPALSPSQESTDQSPSDHPHPETPSSELKALIHRLRNVKCPTFSHLELSVILSIIACCSHSGNLDLSSILLTLVSDHPLLVHSLNPTNIPKFLLLSSSHSTLLSSHRLLFCFHSVAGLSRATTRRSFVNTFTSLLHTLQFSISQELPQPRSTSASSMSHRSVTTFSPFTVLFLLMGTEACCEAVKWMLTHATLQDNDSEDAPTVPSLMSVLQNGIEWVCAAVEWIFADRIKSSMNEISDVTTLLNVPTEKPTKSTLPQLGPGKSNVASEPSAKGGLISNLLKMCSASVRTTVDVMLCEKDKPEKKGKRGKSKDSSKNPESNPPCSVNPDLIVNRIPRIPNDHDYRSRGNDQVETSREKAAQRSDDGLEAEEVKKRVPSAFGRVEIGRMWNPETLESDVSTTTNIAIVTGCTVSASALDEECEWSDIDALCESCLITLGNMFMVHDYSYTTLALSTPSASFFSAIPGLTDQDQPINSAFQSALLSFSLCHSLNPSSSRLRFSMACLLERMGRREEAEALLKRLLATDPDNIPALSLFSVIHLRHAVSTRSPTSLQLAHHMAQTALTIVGRNGSEKAEKSRLYTGRTERWVDVSRLVIERVKNASEGSVFEHEEADRTLIDLAMLFDYDAASLVPPLHF